MTMDYNTEMINVPAAESAVSSRPSVKLTVLQQLKDEIAREVTQPDIEIPVLKRRGVSVRFSPNITNEQLRAWRANSSNRKTGELDSIKFSCYVVGNTVQGIYINDQLVTDDDGNAITFASPAMMEMTKTDRPLPDAIRAFYAVDPHLEAVAAKILDYAGYGDDVDAKDPTKG